MRKEIMLISFDNFSDIFTLKIIFLCQQNTHNIANMLDDKQNIANMLHDKYNIANMLDDKQNIANMLDDNYNIANVLIPT